MNTSVEKNLGSKPVYNVYLSVHWPMNAGCIFWQCYVDDTGGTCMLVFLAQKNGGCWEAVWNLETVFT